MERDLRHVPLDSNGDFMIAFPQDTPENREKAQEALRAKGCEWITHHPSYTLESEIPILTSLGKKPLHADWRQRMDEYEQVQETKTEMSS